MQDYLASGQVQQPEQHAALLPTTPSRVMTSASDASARSILCACSVDARHVQAGLCGLQTGTTGCNIVLV